MVLRLTLPVRIALPIGICALLVVTMFGGRGPVRIPNLALEGKDRLIENFPSQVSTADPSGGVVLGNVTVSRIPEGVAYDDANRLIYVTNNGSNSTSVISGMTVVATIPVGFGPHGVAYDERDRYVYVANSFYPNNSVSVINGTSVVATIPMLSPWDVAFDNGNGYVYVTRAGGAVSVLDGTTVVANITAGLGTYASPHGVAYNGSNGLVYVADYGLDMVHVMSGTGVIGNVTVGSHPEGLGYDRGNGYIYVANQDSNNVSVINGTTLVATISVGPNPRGVAYASSNGFVYVTNNGGRSVSVIKDTTVVDTILLGPTYSNTAPEDIAYDNANMYLYVPSADGIVNVISTTTDYSLYNKGPVSITAGSSGNVTLTTRLTSSPPARVTLSCAGLAQGITCQSFSVNPVTLTSVGSESVLNISVASYVATGSYSFLVTCAPLGETTAPTNVSIIVTAKAANLILGLDPTVFSITVAAIVAALALVGSMWYRAIRRRRAVAASQHQ